jgi:hypothetical protein
LYDGGGEGDREDDVDELVVEEDEGVVRTITGTGMSARQDNGDRDFSTSFRRLELSCATRVTIAGRVPAFRCRPYEAADGDEDGAKRKSALVAPIPR